MKPQGAIARHKTQRVKVLYNLYKAYLCTHQCIVMHDLYHHIASLPSPRFWVTPERASKVVCALTKGCKLSHMRPLRRQMFKDIYERVLHLRQREPHLSIERACAIVVKQPAPQFYLTPKSIKVMICKYRRECKAQRLNT